MKAQRIHSWGGPLQFETVAEPEPHDGEVLVQVEACGVGLTVLNCIRGDLGNDPHDLPRIPGHEVVGRIVRCGSGVDPGKIGRRITSYFYLCCGACRHCLAGAEPLCESVAGFLGVHRDGGYAEFVALPERNAIPCPDNLNSGDATVIPDAVATPVHVARVTRIAAGEHVAVIGAGGGVGAHMVQVARLKGADVIGLDAAEPKLAYLEGELGIPALDSSDFGHARLPAAWNHEADVVIDLIGTSESTEWGISSLSAGGRLALLTTFRDRAFTAPHRHLVLKELAVVGSRYATRREVEHAGELVATGRVQPVVGATADLASVEYLHRKIRIGELTGRGAVVFRG